MVKFWKWLLLFCSFLLLFIFTLMQLYVCIMEHNKIKYCYLFSLTSNLLPSSGRFDHWRDERFAAVSQRVCAENYVDCRSMVASHAV